MEKCPMGLGHLVDPRATRGGLFLSDLPCAHWIDYVRELEAKVARHERKPWCTCGVKTMQGEYHKRGCPAREKYEQAKGV
jgi:hypothetical protein